MTIRKAYFRKYNTGAFRKILGWGDTPEDALIMAMLKAKGLGLLTRGYKCVGGEEISFRV
jgi:hypothetical protein